MSVDMTVLFAELDNLRRFIGSPDIALLTGITTPPIEIQAGEYTNLNLPGVAVALTIPQPTPQDIQIYGDAAMFNWHFTVIVASQKDMGKRQGIMYCSGVLSILKEQIEFGAGRAFHALQPDPLGYIDVIENTASSTVMALNYVRNFPI